MIDFACKQFNLKDVIKCSLGLTKADFEIFEFLLKSKGHYKTDEISKKVGVDLSTVQRAVKKLHEKNLIKRTQINLTSGGYVFVYQINDKKIIKKIIMDTVHSWTVRVDQELDTW